MSLVECALLFTGGKNMNAKNNNKTIIIVVIAVVAICAVFTIILLCIGIPLVMRYINPVTPTREVQVTEQVTQQNVPAINLQGIWQHNGSMAAGWAERYHFYPSGTFHFYPSEMACREEKIEKIGTWKLENTTLTLTTTKQVINRLEVYSNGLCSVKEKKVVALTTPVITQLPIVDYGTQKRDIYPSISINDIQFWKFSDDPSSYGDETFPE